MKSRILWYAVGLGLCLTAAVSLQAKEQVSLARGRVQAERAAAPEEVSRAQYWGIFDPLLNAVTYDEANTSSGQAYQQAVVTYINGLSAAATLDALKNAIYQVDICYNQAVDAVAEGNAADIAQQVNASKELLTALQDDPANAKPFEVLPGIADFSTNVVTAAAAFGISIDDAGTVTCAHNIANRGADVGAYQETVAQYLQDSVRQGTQASATTANLLVAAKTVDPLYNQAMDALKAGISPTGGVTAIQAIVNAVNASEQLLAVLQPGPYSGGLNPVWIRDTSHNMEVATVAIMNVPFEVINAAAAFGVQVVAATSQASIFVPFANVTGTPQYLHFHQGDYSKTNGLFVGMDKLGVSSSAAEQRTYALARATQNSYGGLKLSPLAQEKVTLNVLATQDNPLYQNADKGISQLMVTSGQPVAMLNSDPTSVYYLPATSVAQGGSQVLVNADAADPVTKANQYPLKDPAGVAITTVYDMAVTQNATAISNATGARGADKSKNVIFVAGASNSVLTTKANADTLGVSAIAIQDKQLEPLQTAKTNDNTTPANNKSVQIDLAAGKFVAQQNAASFAASNPDAVNLWWDDRYGKLFGTIKGIQPGANNNDIAYGLFQGSFDTASNTFALAPMETLATAVKTGGSTSEIAASIFGAAIKTDTKTSGQPIINLTRPRTMHTSTDKDYLLVTGGVEVTNTVGGEQAWVNALPIMPTTNAAPGKLAQNDFSGVLGTGGYNAAKTPIVKRDAYTAVTIDDQQTPVVVGRHPSYLATVEGETLTAEKNISGTKSGYAILPGSSIAPTSVIAGGSTLGQGSYIANTNAGGGVGAYVKFDPNSTFVADTAIVGSVTENFRLGVGSTMQAKAADDIAVNAGSITGDFVAKTGSILSKGSIIKNTSTIASDASVDFNAGQAVQAVPEASTLKQDSIIAAGSTFDKTGSSFAFGAGPQVKLGYNSEVTYGVAGITIPANVSFNTKIAQNSKDTIISRTASLSVVSAAPITFPDEATLGDNQGLTNLTVGQNSTADFEMRKDVTINSGAILPRTALFDESKADIDYHGESANTFALPNGRFNSTSAWYLAAFSAAGDTTLRGDLDLVDDDYGVKIPRSGEIPGGVFMYGGFTILPPFTLFNEGSTVGTPDYSANIYGAPNAKPTAGDSWVMLNASVVDAGKVINDFTLAGDQSIKIVPDGIITHDGTIPVVIPAGGYVPRYSLFKEDKTAASAVDYSGITGAPNDKFDAVGLQNVRWVLLKSTDDSASDANAVDGLAQANTAIASGKVNTVNGFVFDATKVMKIPLDGKLVSQYNSDVTKGYDIVIQKDTILPENCIIGVPAKTNYGIYLKNTAGGDIAGLDNTGKSYINSYKLTADATAQVNFALSDGAYIQIPADAISNFSPCMPMIQGDITIKSATANLGGTADNKLPTGVVLSLPSNTEHTFVQGTMLPTAAGDLTPGYDLAGSSYAIAANVEVVGGTLKKDSKLAAGSKLATVDLSGAETDWVIDTITLGYGCLLPRTTIFNNTDFRASVKDGPDASGKKVLLPWQTAGSGVVTAGGGVTPGGDIIIPKDNIIGQDVHINDGTVLPQFTLFQKEPTTGIEYAKIFALSGAPDTTGSQGISTEWVLLNWDGTTNSYTVGKTIDSNVAPTYKMPAGAAIKLPANGVIANDGTSTIYLPAGAVLPAGTMLQNNTGNVFDFTTYFDTYTVAYDKTQLGAIADGSSYTLNGNVTCKAIDLKKNTAITFPPSLVVNCAPQVGGGRGLLLTGNIDQLPVTMKIVDGDVVGTDRNTIAQNSIFTNDSTLETAFKVVTQTLTVPTDFKCVNQKFTVKSGALEVDNAGVTKMAGNCLELDDTSNVINVTVGSGGAYVSADCALPCVATLAGGSVLKPDTVLGNDMTLAGPLKMTVDTTLAADSVVNVGSTLKLDSVIGQAAAAKVTGVGASTDPLALANMTNAAGTWGQKYVLNAGSLKLQGSSKIDNATADGALLMIAAGVNGLTLPGTDWTMADKMTVGTDLKGTIAASTQATLQISSNSTLANGSSIAAGSVLVTGSSTFGFSSSDMQVIGDSVYLALEGDRTNANGVESGIFKSTAVFANDGKVRGWTPWHRLGGSTDATAFFGVNPNTNNVVYLTSPTGEGILDYSTGFDTPTVINPATAAKLTTWTQGDDQKDVEIMTSVPGKSEYVSLHNGNSLGKFLQTYFAGSGMANQGVYGLFDFDPDTPGFAPYDRLYEDPKFACMVATGYERVALIQTGVFESAAAGFVPTKEFTANTNSFVFDAAASVAAGVNQDLGLSGMGAINIAEWTRKAGSDNFLFVGGQGGLAALTLYDVNTAQTFGTGGELSEFGNGNFPETFSFKQLAAAGDSFANVRRIVADEVSGFIYVVTPSAVYCMNPYSTGFFTNADLTYGALSTDRNYVKIADLDNTKYPAGGAAMLDKNKDSFTDIMIVQVASTAPYATKLLLATTNGMFVSAPIANNFAGDAGAIQTLVWSPVVSTAAAPYNVDLNARTAQAAAGALGGANWNNLADAATGVIAYLADYYVTTILGKPNPAAEYSAVALPAAKNVALALGVPQSIVSQITDAVLSQADAGTIRRALDTAAAAGQIGASLAAITADPVFTAATTDAVTKLFILGGTIVADVQQYLATDAGHTIAVVSASGAGAVGTIRTEANKTANNPTNQMLSLDGEFGPLVSWFDQASPPELLPANAGLKTVLRLEPMNLQSGKRLVLTNGNYNFEGNIYVYATDWSGSELRLYRLNATGITGNMVINGIAETENKDAKGVALPYFARLGSVDPKLLTDLNSNFFSALLDGGELDELISTYGGVPSLLSPDQISSVQSAAQPRLLDAGNDYSSSLLVPQLATAWNSASGALYIPTSDGVRVNE